MTNRAIRRAQRQATRRTTGKEEKRARRRIRRTLLRYLLYAGVAILAISFIASLVIAALPGRHGGGAPPSGVPGTSVPDLGRDHFRPGDTAPAGYYNSVPPTSGRHAGTWARCGIHETPVPDENQVHSLEHGFVIISYNTQDGTTINALKEIVQRLPRYPDYTILAPYPKMQQPIALTAWGRIQYLDRVDDQAIQDFAAAYRGRGPEAGAPSC